MILDREKHQYLWAKHTASKARHLRWSASRLDLEMRYSPLNTEYLSTLKASTLWTFSFRPDETGAPHLRRRNSANMASVLGGLTDIEAKWYSQQCVMEESQFLLFVVSLCVKENGSMAKFEGRAHRSWTRFY